MKRQFEYFHLDRRITLRNCIFQGEKGAKGDPGPMGLPVSTKRDFNVLLDFLFRNYK